MPNAADITITFAKRQTFDSRFSHFEGTDAELIQRVLDAWDKRQRGYRDGVLEVPVSPEGFFTGVVQLQEGDKLTGTFEPRRPGEEPRKAIGTPAGGRSKLPAKAVSIILYRADVLAEEEGYEPASEWEVISLNASPTEEAEPMQPETAMANHFGASGGTETTMSDPEFVAYLRTCWEHWHDKALLIDEE